jgi:hypothetical protein
MQIYSGNVRMQLEAVAIMAHHGGELGWGIASLVCSPSLLFRQLPCSVIDK